MREEWRTSPASIEKARNTTVIAERHSKAEEKRKLQWETQNAAESRLRCPEPRSLAIIVGKLRFPIHFVCVSAALYHRGVRGRHFPLRWIWPIRQKKQQKDCWGIDGAWERVCVCMCWIHVRRCTGACIRPKMCGIESRGECISVCWKDYSYVRVQKYM